MPPAEELYVENLALKQENAELRAQNEWFKRKVFGGGQSEKLPPWAGEIGAESWAEFLLKFIVSYPGTTCAIPATSKVAHVRENMRAGRARLPDGGLRKRMIAYVEEI